MIIELLVCFPECHSMTPLPPILSHICVSVHDPVCIPPPPTHTHTHCFPQYTGKNLNSIP